jgi:hypothetical protein
MDMNNNDDNNEFNYLFDGVSMDGWSRPVLVNLYLLNRTIPCDQKEKWGYYGTLKRSSRILYPSLIGKLVVETTIQVCLLGFRIQTTIL